MLERRLEQAERGFRCQRCFAQKDLKPFFPEVFLCKSCAYELSKVMDFFTYSGYVLVPTESLGSPSTGDPQLPENLKPGLPGSASMETTMSSNGRKARKGV